MGVKTIITTVGTSLIANFVYKNEDYDLRALSDKEEKEKSVSLEKVEYEDFKEILEEEGIINDIKKFTLENFPNSSAELTSLQKLKEKYTNDDFIVYLLISDTFEGYFIGEILKEVLESENIKEKLNINEVKFRHIENLRIDNTETFEKGLDNLIEKIYKIITKDKDKNIVYSSEEVIFNITGGYKGVIPYISTIAQIFGYEIVYTFEDTEKENDLLSIEPLPVEVDKSLLDLYYPFLVKINDLLENEKILLKKKGLLKEDDQELTLTPLGKILLLSSEKTVLKKDAFGHFIEFLVYEYFSRLYFNKELEKENCLSNFFPNKIEVGKSLGEGRTDIDIYLENQDKFIWIEVKPISSLFQRNRFKSLKKQIEKHLDEINIFNKTLNKYILVLYSFAIDETETDCNKKFNLVNRKYIRELQSLFSNKNLSFDICYFCLPWAEKDQEKGDITYKTYQHIFKDFKLTKLNSLKNLLEDL